MAKRDGDDNLSPEMQAKMQAAKKLQDELNAKLSQFGQIASNKNMSSVKEYDDLEKELLELKKYAASVKNENDAKLNDMINAMNKKMEKMAKTALEEQGCDTVQYLEFLDDVKLLFTRLINIYESIRNPSKDKQAIKVEYEQFKSFLEERIKDAQDILEALMELLKKVKSPENVVKLTRSQIGSQVDNWVEKINVIRHPLPDDLAIPGLTPMPSKLRKSKKSKSVKSKSSKKKAKKSKPGEEPMKAEITDNAETE
ncbi:uncharacterized protein LOC106670106 isoform X1 [Cimex lectularius]|uniref:Uncharacterized protein n=1 Tax=Cimex lectularius TaxID=79782 RepID=A0A8I6S1W8_CIMLE|nr:uncharacterized protein LOC106670106 isoform X1 [Cimex lectularius]XP_024086453.1 uncharacterized protein LOC106670106 isoform X1 [Cimex lectularius]